MENAVCSYHNDEMGSDLPPEPQSTGRSRKGRVTVVDKRKKQVVQVNPDSGIDEAGDPALSRDTAVIAKILDEVSRKMAESLSSTVFQIHQDIRVQHGQIIDRLQRLEGLLLQGLESDSESDEEQPVSH